MRSLGLMTKCKPAPMVGGTALRADEPVAFRTKQVPRHERLQIVLGLQHPFPGLACPLHSSHPAAGKYFYLR